ncbi:anti-repressor SinI family protein [Evansella sp. AB-rgal1]|uniref:anti-repressor SinI family protein n=1 Tax=Evansella sp. AB-rgal1 TaxID=3242696 RepID=UPI00359E8E86
MLKKGHYSLLQHNKSKSELDLEWASLMEEAKEMGLSPKEVRSFLRGGSQDDSQRFPKIHTAMRKTAGA